ncbi:hypothetical protein GCM10023194_19830 [Planotetraspora phitsanulokensis]|uniref:Uncharacterized protein n=1 Tax=Planotetraspora phitsanulokensis TaxID=575192 RepID=A0A8J3U779_9ACTN|nr:hypothetical protein Pph01_43890 [Planotetraspora phitsanulokensis]
MDNWAEDGRRRDGSKARQSLYGLERFLRESALPRRTIHPVNCGSARSTGAPTVSRRTAVRPREEGETDQRLFTVAAWRDAPFHTDAQ